MEFKRTYLIGIFIGIALIIIDFIFLKATRFFIPLIIISISIAWINIWADFFLEGRRKKEYEARFLDFVRNLVGSIKSGMPAPRAIIHVSNESDYGALNSHVKKLANQLEWAIPVHRALKNFAFSTNNEIIQRSISTVIEAELAGGNIEEVLESITVSLVEIKKIKDQRRSSIHSQILQSYIIFFVFLGIMIVIQNLLIPYLGNMNGSNLLKDEAASGAMSEMTTTITFDTTNIFSFIESVKRWFVCLHGIFLMLALIQGLFAGIIIGKLSEGDLTSGLKHSLILMTIAFVIITFFQG